MWDRLAYHRDEKEIFKFIDLMERQFSDKSIKVEPYKELHYKFGENIIMVYCRFDEISKEPYVFNYGESNGYLPCIRFVYISNKLFIWD